MTAPLNHSHFITVEGVDGSGKSSHIQNICDYFSALGYRVVATREPGGCPLGEKLRTLLLTEPMEAQAETMLMFAARREHVETVIQPALESGAIVVCDRFSDSSWAYQSGGKQVDPCVLENLEAMAHPHLQPGLTLLFDLPVEVSLERLTLTGKIPDKFESAGAAFFSRVRKAYQDRAQQYDRFRLIDSTNSLEHCKSEVFRILQQHRLHLEAGKPKVRVSI